MFQRRKIHASFEAVSNRHVFLQENSEHILEKMTVSRNLCQFYKNKCDVHLIVYLEKSKSHPSAQAQAMIPLYTIVEESHK
jgi:hypothetical protein